MTEPPLFFIYLVDVLPRFASAAGFIGVLLVVFSLVCLVGYVYPFDTLQDKERFLQEQRVFLRLSLYSSVAAASLILFRLLTPSRSALSTMLGL